MDALERYNAGKFVSGVEWTEDLDGAWEVTKDLADNKAVDQIGLDGDHYYRKLIPNQEQFIEPTDEMRIADVRSQLRMHFDGARGMMSDPQSSNAGEL